MSRLLTPCGLILIAAAAALAALAPRPVLDNSVRAWLPRRASALATFEDFQAGFGTDEVALLRLSDLDGPARLSLTTELSDALDALEGVRSVTSAPRAFPDAFDVLGDELLGGFSEENWGRLAHHFEGPLNRELGLFEPTSGLGAAVVYAALEPGQPKARAALDAFAEGWRARVAAQGGRLEVASQALVNLELDRASRAVDTTAMPLLVGLCVALVLATTRSPRLTAALFIPVALCVFGSEGLLGLSGASGNLIVTVSKPLLFVLTMAGGLHVIVDTQHRRAAAASSAEAAWAAAAHKARPCLMANLTTAIGFGSLGFAEVAPVRDFGLLVAAGLGLASLLTLLGLPAIVSLIGAPAAPAEPGRMGRLPGAMLRAGARRPALMFALAAGLIAAGVAGYAALRVQPHAIKYFPTTHPLRRDAEAIERAGRGLANLELVFAASADALARSPERRERLLAVDAVIAAAREAETATARIDPLIALREAGWQTARVDAPPANANLDEAFEALELRGSNLVTADGRRLRASLLLRNSDAAELAEVEARARAAFAASLLPAAGWTLTATGSYPLLIQTQDSLLETLQLSLLSTSLLMLLVLLIVLRSLRLALLSAIPNALPVAANFALMAALGIGLDVGTTMTAAIALGIAVDDTIHILVAWRRGGLEEATDSTGQAITLTSLVIGAGFASLMSQDFGPTWAFGLLSATAMGVAWLGDLLVLPGILSAARAKIEAPADDRS